MGDICLGLRRRYGAQMGDIYVPLFHCTVNGKIG